jgi:predicted acyltransferase (DUF342 family)
MEMASIKAHKDSNTLIIMKNSNYTRPITHRINLIAGLNARCMEQVAIEGNLELGKAARIMGDAMANNVILGPGSVIMGDLTVGGDLLALDNARVTGHVYCVGGAMIRPGVAFGSLDVGGLIELQGKAPCRHVRGKVVVNEASDLKPAKKAGKPSKKEAELPKKSAHKNMGGEEPEEGPKKRKWLPW